MPLGAMGDLYGYYWVGHQFAYHGVIPLNHLGGYFAVWPPFYLHAAWLWLIRPLLGPGDPWGEGLIPSAALDPYWIGPEALGVFYAQLGAHRYWVLFLLKCPYLLTELLLVWLLLRQTTGEAARRRLSWFLWLNPVTCFFVYLCGTWDIIPVTVMVGGLLLLPRQPGWAGLCWALAAIMKAFPVLLMPFVVLLGARTREDRVYLGASIVLPLLFFLLVGQSFGVSMLATAFGLPHYGMLTGAQLSLQPPHDRLYLFLVGYVVLLLHAGRRGEASRLGLVRYGAAVLLGFYSLAFFHPQYFFWCLPLLAILVAEDRGLLKLFILQVIGLGAYVLQFGPTFTTHLLAPLSPGVLLHARAPLERLSGVVDPGLFVGIAHSVFAAVSLWMAYEILRGHPRPRALS